MVETTEQLKQPRRAGKIKQGKKKPDITVFRTLSQLSCLMDELVHRECSTNFLTFVRKFAPSIVPDWKMGKHIELLAKKLQLVHEGKIKRLMVFLPPRSSKSVICSKLFPAFYIGNYPHHEIMSISHSDQLASDFGRSVRDIVSTQDFGIMFHDVELRQDVRAAGKWRTNKHGSYYAAGVRSQIAGRGANIAILDDAMSEEDAISSAGRKYIKEWWPSGLRTRLMPNGAIIIINTRFHYDDLCGWLLKQEDKYNTRRDDMWQVVKIPAWLDEESSKLLGLPVGSSYFPEWKTDAILKRDEIEIRSTNGSKYWESLFMQNPTQDEGGLIRKTWIKWWQDEKPPECKFIIQTYDTAFSSKTTADFSVIQTWGIFNDIHVDNKGGRESVVGHLILLGSIRGRYEYPELRRIAQEQFRIYKPDICIIEKKASGQSLIQDMRRAGLPVLEYNPDKDKVSRVYAVTPLFEAGRVWFPSDKLYSQDLFDELVSFPFSPHDDQVDACAMAVNYVKESWRVVHHEDADWNESGVGKQKRVAYWRV